MRLVIAALAFTALGIGAANADLLWSEPFAGFSAGGLKDGVACKVKRVTVLAQNKADCFKIGGKMLRVKQAKAAH